LATFLPIKQISDINDEVNTVRTIRADLTNTALSFKTKINA
jgi:hypothetical protein